MRAKRKGVGGKEFLPAGRQVCPPDTALKPCSASGGLFSRQIPNPNPIFPNGGDFSCRGYCHDGAALLPISDDNTTTFCGYSQFLFFSNFQLIHNLRGNID